MVNGSLFNKAKKGEIEMANIWTIEDVAAGKCEFTDIGNIIPSTLTEEQTQEAFDIFECELAAYRDNPDWYRVNCASNLNKILDIAARRIEKDDGKTHIEKMSDAELEGISNSDLKRYIIATSAPGAQYTEESRLELINEIAREACQHCCGKKPFKPTV
jgi:hypothetical protein